MFVAGFVVHGQISFLNSNGLQMGNTLNVQLAPDQVTFLELRGSKLVAARLASHRSAGLVPAVWTGSGCGRLAGGPESCRHAAASSAW